MTQPLYPDQARCVEAINAAVDRGARAPLVVAPPAFGKTRIGVEILRRANEKGNAGLWMAPRRELVDQTVDSLRRNGVDRVTVLRGSDRRHDPGALITVASIQTMLARPDTRPPAKVIVLDEARHYVASDWHTVAQDYPDAYRIGLDATPASSTGRAMGGLFDVIIVGAKPSDLIRAGRLVPCRVMGPPEPSNTLAEHPVDAFVRLAPRRHPVVFAASVEHAQRLTDEFVLRGVSARCITGKTRRADRDRWVAEFRTGEVQVLVGMGVFVEGFDAPICDCVMLCRRVGGPGTLIQMCGRGMRLYPGKSDCLVLDLMGSCIDLAVHPDDDLEYSLEGKPITKPTERGDRLRACPDCGMLFWANEYHDSTCPECGYVRPGKRDPRVVQAAIREQHQADMARRAAKTASAHVEALRDLLAESAAKKWKARAVGVRFHGMFGYWPSKALIERCRKTC